MTGPLAAMLAKNGHLLADGGMGTGLMALGLTLGECPELWNVFHPDRVLAMHRGFIEAGSDLVLTNSFGGNAKRLATHGAEDRLAELNTAAVRIARKAAAEAGRPVLVAGCIGPLDVPPKELAEASFAAQATALARAGADVLWIETMGAAEELEAAVQAAARTGLEVCATMSFHAQGRTASGLTPTDSIALAHALPLAAFGANCGDGPAGTLASIKELAAAARPGDVLIAKGNSGIRAPASPGQMAEHATLARALGARIIGGCCGTTAAHLAAMRRALDSR